MTDKQFLRKLGKEVGHGFQGNVFLFGTDKVVKVMDLFKGTKNYTQDINNEIVNCASVYHFTSKNVIVDCTSVLCFVLFITNC